jgi:hypothetical protein
MMYRVIFHLGTPVSFTERPVFDALLYYAYMAKRVGKYSYMTPTGAELRKIIATVKLPLNQQDGFYLCSYAFFGQSVQGADSWKKRWESRYDRHADFGRGMRRVNTASGEYRSYNVPFVALSVDKIWFYYDTEQPAMVRELIDGYLVGIGKKVNIGFGWIDRVEYELARDGAAFRGYCRPLPKQFSGDNLAAIFPEYPKLKICRGAYRPPYWFPEFQEEIMTPEIHEDVGM